MVLGYILTQEQSWLRLAFDPGRPVHLIALFAAVLGLWVILRHPEIGLLLLVGALYSNASEVMVRYHQLPSILHVLAIGLTLVVLGQLGLRRRPLVVDRVLLAFLLYLFAMFFSSAVASSSELADEKLLEFVKGLLIFLTVLNLATSRESLRRTACALVFVGAVLGTISVFQVLTSSYSTHFFGFGRVKLAQIVGSIREPRIAGPLSDPNFYAQILVALVPIALYRLWDRIALRWKLLAGYAFGVIVLAIIFTYSRGGALALGAVILLTAIDKTAKVRHLVLPLALITVVTLFVPDEFQGRLSTLEQLFPDVQEVQVHTDSSFRQRMLLMQGAWLMFLDHPLLGVGAGNYCEHYQEYADRIGSTASSYEDFDEKKFPHSLYLEVAAENGLVGLTLFAALLTVGFSSARAAVQGFARAGDQQSANLVKSVALGLIGYLVSSLFLHGHYIRHLWLLLAFLVAAKSVAQRGEQKPLLPGGKAADSEV